MSKLPHDSKPIRLDPDLAAFLENELKPYSGKALEWAQAAILEVRSSGFVGAWAELTARYREAIREATEKVKA